MLNSAIDQTPVRQLDSTERAPASTADHPAEPPRYLNSVDATVGQPLVDRVATRKLELEAALAALAPDAVRERSDIELALSTIGEMLTGNLSHVPAIVAADMNRWLERTKHLAETPVAAVSDPATAPIEAPTSVEPYATVGG